MKRVFGLLWLALLWGQPKSYAQQLGWEKALAYKTPPYAAGNIVGYLRQVVGGDCLASGIGDRMGVGYPFIYARVQIGGTLVYQRQGRKIGTLEHDVVVLAGANGSSLLAASIPIQRAGSTTAFATCLFFQRIRPNGDTLLGMSHPLNVLEGFPVRAVREGDSVRVLALAYDS